MRQVIRFEPNQPVTVALEFPEGVNVLSQFNGPQVKFSLTENRLMYLDPEPARALAVLKVQPGELFTITKRTPKGKSPWWDFERVRAAGATSKGGGASDTTGLDRQANGYPETGAARVPDEGSEAIRAAVPPNSPASAPKIEPDPVPAPKPALSAGDLKRIPPQSTPAMPPHAGGIHLTRTPPVKPSYEEAFRECLRIVTEGLAGAREQWSDGAKQAMVSTLLIQLGRENRLGEFRPQQIGKVA